MLSKRQAKNKAIRKYCLPKIIGKSIRIHSFNRAKQKGGGFEELFLAMECPIEYGCPLPR